MCRAYLGAILLSSIFCISMYSCFLFEKTERLMINADDVESLYLEIYRAEGAVRKYSVEDEYAISYFVRIVNNRGSAGPVHKSSSWGYISIKERNGNVNDIYIRPGDDKEFYIFHILDEGEYKVNREKFLKFLKIAGVTEKYFIVP